MDSYKPRIGYITCGRPLAVSAIYMTALDVRPTSRWEYAMSSSSAAALPGASATVFMQPRTVLRGARYAMIMMSSTISFLLSTSRGMTLSASTVFLTVSATSLRHVRRMTVSMVRAAVWRKTVTTSITMTARATSFSRSSGRWTGLAYPFRLAYKRRIWRRSSA